MNTFSNLVEMLEYWAGDSGDGTAFTFHDRLTSYGTLWTRVNHFATVLLRRGIEPQECVVLALPNGEEFFDAFYGVQRAGGIPVPLFPGSNAERIASIAGFCNAKMVVLPDNSQTSEGLNQTGLTSLSVSVDELNENKRDFPRIMPEDIAFLQFTSGSMGDPKGVMITHANLITNVKQMITGMKITTEDKFVSWLPLYHDMGLILMTMVPFFLGIEAHLLSADLRYIQDWFRTIQNVHGTFTAAPDFAYRYCLRHADELRKYDISSLRVALNAAEPVRSGTIQDFESAFGLDRIMVAGYGLAEATVGVSMWHPGTPARIDDKGIVSVGKPFSGIGIKIGESEEILVKSPANSPGYFNNEQATREIFTSDGYIHTGDSGYLDPDGYLYITGRRKNIIKHAGETISPQELEETVDGLDGVRYSAAVGIDRGRMEGEQALVFVEVRLLENVEDWGYELTLKIVKAVHARVGFRPARVFLLIPGTIPRTPNGKIQYTRLREKYLNGTLHRQGRILFPKY